MELVSSTLTAVFREIEKFKEKIQILPLMKQEYLHKHDGKIKMNQILPKYLINFC